MTNNGFKVGLHFYMKKENMANNLKYLNILLRANIYNAIQKLRDWTFQFRLWMKFRKVRNVYSKKSVIGVTLLILKLS